MKSGDQVKYSRPQQGEESARFELIEISLDCAQPRARIRLLNSGLRIPPQEMVAASEIEPA